MANSFDFRKGGHLYTITFRSPDENPLPSFFFSVYVVDGSKNYLVDVERFKTLINQKDTELLIHEITNAKPNAKAMSKNCPAVVVDVPRGDEFLRCVFGFVSDNQVVYPFEESVDGSEYFKILEYLAFRNVQKIQN